MFIESGDFNLAVKKLDELLTINPDYPGLAESYRVARFWNSRKKNLDELSKERKPQIF
jgi:hypothetical protein